MNLSKIDEYASQIPIEIKKAVKAFGNDVRCAIVVDLIGKGELTFTQLMDDLDIEPGLLSNHLKVLMDGAVVEHYYKHELGNEQYSYYGLTLFGKDFLRGILEPLRAVQQPRLESSSAEGEIAVGFPIPSHTILIGERGEGTSKLMKMISYAPISRIPGIIASSPSLSLPKRKIKKPMAKAA